MNPWVLRSKFSCLTKYLNNNKVPNIKNLHSFVFLKKCSQPDYFKENFKVI